MPYLTIDKDGKETMFAGRPKKKYSKIIKAMILKFGSKINRDISIMAIVICRKEQ